jgi:hypothetical protein
MEALQVTLLAFLILFDIGCAGEREKKQLVELRKIAAETPLYPGFEKTGEKAVLKQGMVYFHTYYLSNAQFSEIRAFYDGVLVQKGWGPPETSGPSLLVPGEANWVHYRRGDYVISVAQDEGRSDRFVIVFIWDPQ